MCARSRMERWLSWSKALDSKSSVAEMSPWVRIPLSPSAINIRKPAKHPFCRFSCVLPICKISKQPRRNNPLALFSSRFDDKNLLSGASPDAVPYGSDRSARRGGGMRGGTDNGSC